MSDSMFYGGLLGNKLPENTIFKLSKSLIQEYQNKKPPFGFNGLGEIVYLRTYAREKDNGDCENWIDTVERVVNGVFEILQHYTVNKLHCEWDIDRANKLAEDMFVRIFTMKFLPPGRGLWAMGSPIITKKGFAAALNNCAFVSTNNLITDKSYPFTFLMDASMLGVGVGFDTSGANSFIVQKPKENKNNIHIITDDREGWVHSVKLLLDSYFEGSDEVHFDYSKIRSLGTKLKTFGGTSSGPGPLINLHNSIRNTLNNEMNKPISITCITDIMNMIGVCTVSGNIRRCLPANSLIHTFEGLIEIQHVKIGTLVQTLTGYEKIKNIFIQGKQKLITIKTENGYFKCTHNHYMCVQKLNSYKWVMSAELKPGDHLITTRVPIIGKKTYLPKWNYSNSVVNTIHEIITVPELDSDIAWLIGLLQNNAYIFEPHFHDIYKSYMYTICHNINYDIAIKIVKLFKKFNNDLRVEIVKLCNNNYSIKFISNNLNDYIFKEIKNVGIPEYIKNAYLDIRLGYIAGVIDGNQYRKIVEKNTINIISSSNKNWATDLQVLCYSCGFETNLCTINMSKKEYRKYIYHLNAVTKYSIRLLNSIPQLFSKFTMIDDEYYFTNCLKYLLSCYCCSCEITNTYHLSKVIDIEYTNEIDETYDLEIENVHNFYCNGYLSHNSAEIAFGSADCKEFLDLKSYDTNPHRQAYGWASNNSIFAELGMDYTETCERIIKNGEPGFAWLSNMQSFSRMNGEPDYKDQRVSGGNPCLEQSLESMELCCLVETFPNNNESLEDFKQTLYSAFLFAKTVTLLPLHWSKSNEIMMRNRRIGCSVTGIAQFITDKGLHILKNWLEDSYKRLHEIDKEISEWLCIRQSIKLTSVKPSGTISLLAGATPGIHYPESKYYIRRLRIAAESPLLKNIIAAGYYVEPCVVSPDTTIVVEFPITVGANIRTLDEVSMWEQLSLAAFMQKYWSDNQVSCSVVFDPETEGHQLVQALNYFQYQLKGISFLPRLKQSTAYQQMPYEAITKEKYYNLISKINYKLSLSLSSSSKIISEAHDELHMNYCDNDQCLK